MPFAPHVILMDEKLPVYYLAAAEFLDRGIEPTLR